MFLPTTAAEIRGLAGPVVEGPTLVFQAFCHFTGVGRAAHAIVPLGHSATVMGRS
jgi:hypothetical protein